MKNGNGKHGKLRTAVAAVLWLILAATMSYLYTANQGPHTVDAVRTLLSD